MTWWRGLADKHWQPLKWVISSDLAQYGSGSPENGIKIVRSWTRRSHWWQDNALEVVPMRITCKRNWLAPKTSVGALTGAQSQPLGTAKEFLNAMQGLYLYPKTAQSTRTGDVWHTSEGEGEFSDSKLQDLLFFTCESPSLFIKNPDINSRIYEAPNAMAPSCFSVLQYSTLQIHSKGQNTFPSKFH